MSATMLADLPRLVRLRAGFRLAGCDAARSMSPCPTAARPARRPRARPAAAMTAHNYGFASRLINGGDIGIAEAYLHGEWDTPDLTQFLYLFCVNHD